MWKGLTEVSFLHILITKYFASRHLNSLKNNNFQLLLSKSGFTKSKNSGFFVDIKKKNLTIVQRDQNPKIIWMIKNEIMCQGIFDLWKIIYFVSVCVFNQLIK